MVMRQRCAAVLFKLMSKAANHWWSPYDVVTCGAARARTPAASAAADTGTDAAETGCVGPAGWGSAGLAITDPMDAAVDMAAPGASAAEPRATLGSCIWTGHLQSFGQHSGGLSLPPLGDKTLGAQYTRHVS